ncbi:ZIP family metal transporter [Tichowtungia aerotolerans]|uniref:Divalent cation transporter n=1 Tax=Tichowtungia aerotolerans TaxID=2697043 RepID=A0A6P1MBL0_9BACT|nr:divalent cation transporter [Tichowtungia aerotolerans]QHI69478.1 divalent cation transporter [Tichowtungia aerotolerans]
MNQIIDIMLYSWVAGFASFIGAVIARVERIPEGVRKKELFRGIVAFGGGILVAAVAFALVPHGIETLSAPMLGLLFGLGGAAFCLLDILLSRSGGSKAQFTAMLSDFIPEAIALGAVFAHDHRLGILLALFIGAQNLPEGFNAYRELKENTGRTAMILWQMFLISFLGPAAALLGYFFLREKLPVTAGIMVFAAGGILYLIFQDIAPQAKYRHHWLPPLGAVLGFIVGMLGQKLIG